ncbi:hypothetical protein LL912_11505 [Niabella sp. CC-SYL272]|uniref:hypothetical protein n=1 Tax=Niabella agricola TaxID=2891571 RepID=UPI001F3B18CC|nr:hypothetical protein [Niabella agricola]MCF3109403.1 hypothetical protein [Niabella agricola]
MRHYAVFLILLLIPVHLHGQQRKHPKPLQSKGAYLHIATGMTFPEQIETVPRKSIYSLTKQDDNIEVMYETPSSISIAIQIYPAGDGAEGRLRNEYLKALQTISTNTTRTIGFDQGPIRRKGPQYICNGFKARYGAKGEYKNNQVILYECGAWFLKIRLGSTGLNDSSIAALEQRILDCYDPTSLTALKPLPAKSEFLVAPGLGKDRERAQYILKSGLKKLEWVNTHIPENERASGFPDLYLAMHLAALKELEACENEDFSADNNIAMFISTINQVARAGYLPEFLMKQYNMVMIVPENMTFNFEGFAKWQKTRNIYVDMQKRYYLIVFKHPDKKDTDLNQ